MSSIYNVLMSEKARISIRNSMNYIKNNLKNEQAVKKLFNSIQKVIDNIKLFPYMYPAQDRSTKDDSTRKAKIDNYSIIYKINDEKKEVVLLNFKYFKQNK